MWIFLIYLFALLQIMLIIIIVLFVNTLPEGVWKWLTWHLHNHDMTHIMNMKVLCMFMTTVIKCHSLSYAIFNSKMTFFDLTLDLTVLCEFIGMLLYIKYSKILNNKHFTTTNIPTIYIVLLPSIFLSTVSFSSECSKNPLKDNFFVSYEVNIDTNVTKSSNVQVCEKHS